MKKISLISLLVFCFSFITTAQIQTGENIAITNTEGGRVRGYIRNNIFVYKGIPYAEAKRFETPQKPKLLRIKKRNRNSLANNEWVK